jgi:guanylate kinase
MEQDRKAELKVEHEAYLRARPEINQLLNDFVTSCLVQQPNDIFEYARDYFATVAPRHEERR